MALFVERFLWSGLNRLLAVYDGAGALKMRFEYTDDRMQVSMTMAGAIYYIAYDQVGPRLVVDGTGNVVKEVHGNVIFVNNYE